MTGGSGLRGDDARQWARRVPTLVLVLGPAVVAFLAIASIWNEPGDLSGDIATVTSWGEMLTGIPIGVGAAALFTTWYAPRPGAWLMAAAVLPAVLVDDSLSSGPAWMVLVAVAWIAIVVLDAILVLRQRALAADLATTTPGTGRWRADHHLGARLVAGVLLVAGILAAVLFWWNWRTDARAFAERAVPVQAKVVGVDTFFDSVYVKLDGKKREFFVNDAADHPVGSSITINTDPRGEMSPYTDEDADPDSWSAIGLPIGLATALLFVVVVGMGRRRRRVEQLATDGGPALDVLVRLHPVHDALEVFAPDDVTGTRPLAFLPRIEVLVPDRGPAERTGVRGGIDDLVGFGRFLLDRPDPDEPWDEEWVDHDEPPFARPTPAKAIGLLGDGSICVLHLREGDEDVMLASVRPVRDSTTLRTLGARAVERLARTPVGRLIGPSRRGEHAADGEPEDEHIPASTLVVLRLLRATSRVGPLVVAASGLVVLPWLLEGEGFSLGAVFPALIVAGFTAWWWDLSRPRLLQSRWGLRLTSRWLDELILPADVTDVRRSNDHLVVEIRDDEDQIRFDLLPYLDEVAQQAELDEVARLAESVRNAPPGRFASWESHWPRRLPSSSTAVGVLTGVLWAFSVVVR